jgi:adenylylsulfate reductase subunit B
MPPEIDYTKCTSCGRCVNVCAEDVFFGTREFGKNKAEKPIVTYPEACFHCNLCVNECPVPGALKLRIPLTMMIAYKA